MLRLLVRGRGFLKSMTSEREGRNPMVRQPVNLKIQYPKPRKCTGLPGSRPQVDIIGRLELIAIGAGVLERRGFLQQQRREFKARGLPHRIYRTRVGKDAVAIGAAVLVS